jgi:hypothetical protein
LTYAEFAVKCASELAQYQSPKFKAIAVRVEDVPATAPSPPPEDGDAPVAARRKAALHAFQRRRGRQF